MEGSPVIQGVRGHRGLIWEIARRLIYDRRGRCYDWDSFGVQDGTVVDREAAGSGCII